MSLHYSDIFTSKARLVEQKAPGAYEAVYKRLLDVVVVVMSLPIAIPIIAFACLLITLTDGRPPMFRQDRVGKDGKRFCMWKLRTMVPDADRALARHLARDPSAQIEWQTKQKLREDPRVTRIGRILRQTSIDELPQLCNVLAGDMSLVGPRPMMPCQEPLYPGHAYYRTRPGITGSWQIGRRHSSTFAERAEFDDAYVAEINIWSDLRILLCTVGAVLRGTGV